MMDASRDARPAGDHDLLDDVDVVVDCSLCSTPYTVRASVIRESQRVLADGCTGSSLYECAASYFATLVEPEALDDLARAWRRFERSATSHGGLGVVVHSDAPTEALSPAEVDRAALQRWENEGGRCVASSTGVASPPEASGGPGW